METGLTFYLLDRGGGDELWYFMILLWEPLNIKNIIHRLQSVLNICTETMQSATTFAAGFNIGWLVVILASQHHRCLLVFKEIRPNNLICTQFSLFLSQVKKKNNVIA